MGCGGCIDKVRAHLLGLPACCNPFQWVKVGESLSWTQFDHLGLASHSSPGPCDQGLSGIYVSRISLQFLLEFSCSLGVLLFSCISLEFLLDFSWISLGLL